METSFQAQSGAPSPSPFLEPSRWAPTFLIIAGAVVGFALAAKEHFSPSDYIGWKQIVAEIGCAGMLAAGAVWEVQARRRALSEALRFWAIAGVVALAVMAARLYSIESPAFNRFIAPLTLAGFIVNHYLPARLRLPFMLGLGLVAIFGVFGAANLPAAFALIALSLALIGICHLPIPIIARVGILLAAMLGLAAVRVGWIYTGWMAAILPVLASIFMFRLAIYLYDIANGKGPKDWLGRLCYFFLFPNFVFPFFPTVDFSTFGRTYYNDDAIKIYWRAATYVVRGLAHLLVYRLITMYFVLVPDEIHDGLSFLQHIVSNFGLYFRISGLFHLIVGLIALFGFNLPETHTRFYFANSFTDFWRRINIYWKDFMQKMVFTPSYVQFKKFGLKHLTSVALSMAVVFVVTWALHAYQWFWLTGTSLFSLTDMLFWAILGALLITQTLLEARPRKTPLNGFVPPQAFLVVRTVCTFLTICLLWSFWTSHSVDDWLVLIARSGLTPALFDLSTASAVAWIKTLSVLGVAFFMIAITMGVTFGLPAPSPAPVRRAALRKDVQKALPYRGFAVLAAGLAGLLVLQNPAVHALFGAQGGGFITDMATSERNRVNIAMMDRGYYEGVAGGGGFNGELDEMLSPRPKAENAGTNPGMNLRPDYLGREFTPNKVATVAGISFPINRWGMYDQDYALEKPPGTYRIALIGDSRSMGWGINASQRFETLLEERLNREQAGRRYQRYEILNFSVYGYEPIERLMVLEQKALRFHPDAVIYIGGLLDVSTDHFAQMVRDNVVMPYPVLNEIIDSAHINSGMSAAEITRRMEPYRERIQAYVYHRFGDILHANSMPGVWVEIPSISDARHDIPGMVERARQGGFHTINLTGLYDPERYRLSRWDGHPSVAGHQVIADLVYNDLIRFNQAGSIDMGLQPPGSAIPIRLEPSPTPQHTHKAR